MNYETCFKKAAVLLLAVTLICTVLAIFLPYGLEPLLGIAAVCIDIHAIYLAYEKYINPFWLRLVAIAVSVVSVILTLVLILGHKLGLYPLIQVMNLIVIGLSVFIMLRRKWVYRAAVWSVAVLTLAVAVFGAFSHIVYGRSVMSTVSEWVLAANKVHDDDVAALFDELTRAGETTFILDRSAFDKTVIQESFSDMSVLYLNANTNYDSVVIYIHGGYYVYHMGSEQMAAMNRIANRTNAMVVLPIYRLAPFATAEKGHAAMAALYERVCRENARKKIILMGDSAGGGYALALAEGLKARGLPQPDELILLSPWVDVTMSNPDIADYYDPMLTVTMGKMSGEAWAGSLPTDDWLVSPINGDMSDLKNVTIFVGDRELFYPDDTLLYEKLKNNENVTLHVGKGQNHVYPVYPTLEGRIAIEQIIGIVQRNS